MPKTKTTNRQKQDIELVFLHSPRVERGLQQAGAAEESEKFIARIEDIINWFKRYRIDSIELYIEGAVKSGNLTQLFVSFEGKGGCKVVLKPK
jgi:hypothetical protein